MTRYLCDTNGLIASACSWHEHHALTLIEGNWSDTPAVHLTARETWDAVRDAQGRGVRGGQMYDALIATAALKAGASAILTWNRRNFEPFAGDIQIESPP